MIINGFGGGIARASTVTRTTLSTQTVSVADPYTNVVRESLNASGASTYDMSYFTVATIYLQDYITSNFDTIAIDAKLNSITGGVFWGQNTNSASKLGAVPWVFTYDLELRYKGWYANNGVTASSTQPASNWPAIQITQPQYTNYVTYARVLGFSGFSKTNTVKISSTSSGAWTQYNQNSFTNAAVSGKTSGENTTLRYWGRSIDNKLLYTTLFPIVSSYDTNKENVYIFGDTPIDVCVRVRGTDVTSSDAISAIGSSAINIRYYYSSSNYTTTPPTANVTVNVYGIN